MKEGAWGIEGVRLLDSSSQYNDQSAARKQNI